MMNCSTCSHWSPDVHSSAPGEATKSLCTLRPAANGFCAPEFSCDGHRKATPCRERHPGCQGKQHARSKCAGCGGRVCLHCSRRIYVVQPRESGGSCRKRLCMSCCDDTTRRRLHDEVLASRATSS